MSKVTVSLVTFNSKRYIGDFCESLRRQTFTDWELMVVDNNSYDKSVEIVTEHLPGTKIIHQKTNTGFSRPHNLIISWSKGEYVLVVNADLVMEESCIERLVQCLDTHNDVAAAGGKLLYWDFEQYRKTDQIDSAGLIIHPSYRISDRYQGEENRDIPSGQIFGISGSLVMLRRTALEQIKLPCASAETHYEYFDEDFFAYKEDVDLAWRLNLAGWKNYFLSETLAYHNRTISSHESSRKDRKKRSGINRYSYRNQLLMIYKNHFWSVTLRNLISILWFELGKFFYLLFLDGSSVHGLREVISLLPQFRKKRKLVQSRRRVHPAEFSEWLHTA